MKQQGPHVKQEVPGVKQEDEDAAIPRSEFDTLPRVGSAKDTITVVRPGQDKKARPGQGRRARPLESDSSGSDIDSKEEVETDDEV